MRLIHADSSALPTASAVGTELDEAALGRLHAYPRASQRRQDGAWWRANMVASIDGAATGGARNDESDEAGSVSGDAGTSGSLGTEADQRLFGRLRALAQVLVVGAGTVRAENYDIPRGTDMVVVSERAELPPSLVASVEAGSAAGAPHGGSTGSASSEEAEPHPPTGRLVLATGAAAPEGALAQARELLGPVGVLRAPDERVSLSWLRAELAERGYLDVLFEGGPTLLGQGLAEGVTDELCLTRVPWVVGGNGPRIVEHSPLGDDGGAPGVPARLVSLIEHDGVLLGRWRF